MNRFQIVLFRASLLTFFVLVFMEWGECSSNIRQRSDGCGPHPLLMLATMSRSNGVGSLNDVLRAVRADPVVWPVMQNLLHRYDDCIRAADGLHYKRSGDSSKAAKTLYTPRTMYRRAGAGAEDSWSSSGSNYVTTMDSNDDPVGGGGGGNSGSAIISWLPSPI